MENSSQKVWLLLAFFVILRYKKIKILEKYGNLTKVKNQIL